MGREGRFGGKRSGNVSTAKLSVSLSISALLCSSGNLPPSKQTEKVERADREHLETLKEHLEITENKTEICQMIDDALV